MFPPKKPTQCTFNWFSLDICELIWTAEQLKIEGGKEIFPREKKKKMKERKKERQQNQPDIWRTAASFSFKYVLIMLAKDLCVSWMYQLLALNCLPEEEGEEGGGRGDANEHHYQLPPDCPECKVLLTFSALASIVHVSPLSAG